MIAWSGGVLEVEVVVFTKESGILGMSQAAGEFVALAKNAAPPCSSGEASRAL